MNDRELLELAAKAAGISLAWCDAGPYIPKSPPFDTSGDFWNPLYDDGDALRLAVKLELDVFFATRHVRCANRNSDKVAARNKEAGHPLNTDGDPFAATRRAIVRAAAEIGKEMK